MNSKKAQDLSLTTIIVAAVALIVLVVLIAIFSGKIRIFSSGVDDETNSYTSKQCEAPGLQRRCETSPSGECSEGGNLVEGYECPIGKICCAY